MGLKHKTKILMVIRSLKFWWWTEKACINVWDLLNSEPWYDVSYFSFYKDKHTYSHKWLEFCLWKKSRFMIIKIWYSFIWAIKLKKFCSRNDIDIIIAYMGSGILTTILSKIFGNKSQIYVYIHRCLKDFPKWISYLLVFFSKKYSYNFIVLTEYEKNYLTKYFNLSKNSVSVIPNLIDIKDIKNLSIEPINTYQELFQNHKFTFITTGRLENIKNQQLMINTFNKINTQYPNTQLIILWEWKNKGKLRKLANENVHFLWNQENVFNFLHQSDCFILTSKSESFSIAILEAMICWLPVISTKTQWPNEILDDNKYWILVNHNEVSLYNAMEKILLDKDLRIEYRNRSEERVKYYQKDEIMKKWKKLLDE